MTSADAPSEPAGVTIVRLAAEERLLAAYARYDAAWASGRDEEVPAARLELCHALLDCGEVLASEVLAQMHRDQATVARPVVITV